MGQIEKKKETSIQASEELEPYFELINKLDEDDHVFDPRCKFCKSKLREEGEAEWERRRVFSAVVEFFKKHGENMNINNIRNHIRGHYIRQEQLVRRRHYSDHILSVLNHKITKARRIEYLLTILQDKVLKYASLEHENEDRSIKSDDMMVKIVKEITNLLKIQSEIEGELKPVQIFASRVQQVFVSALNKIEDPQVKMAMVKELETLQEANLIDV